jgi:2-amino-4-hydroxy-6-hydroxymethyldihydropteridine diphosphokinase
MHTAYIALGSNLPSPAGSPLQTLGAAMQRLGQFGEILATSSIYITSPVGYLDQPSFVNAAIALRTAIPPHSLLSELLEIELAFGRDRSQGIANGPRTLDLDLVLFADYILGTQILQLPHPRMARRSFVLLPMAEIAPALIHPVLNKSMAQLLQELKTAPEDLSDDTRYPDSVEPDVFDDGESVETSAGELVEYDGDELLRASRNQTNSIESVEVPERVENPNPIELAVGMPVEIPVELTDASAPEPLPDSHGLPETEPRTQVFFPENLR